jgi:hypothetical protein
VWLRYNSSTPARRAFGIVTNCAFALLDTQYLRVERRFRELFDRIRAEDWATPPGFEINLQGAPKVNYWGVFISWSIASFYALLAVGVVLVMFVLELVMFVLEVVHGRIN